MPSKCFASWASPNWTRPPRRRDKNRSCSDQPQNPPPYLLGVTGHNVKHALAFAKPFFFRGIFSAPYIASRESRICMDYEPGFAQITTFLSPFSAIVPFRENADR